MKTIHLFSVGLIVALAGCTTIQVDPTNAPRTTVIPAGFTLPNVRPSIKLATLESSFKQMGNTFNVQTGKIYRQVFTGDDSAPLVLDAVNANMTQHMSDVMLIATSTQITYTASVILIMPDGHRQTFSATGTASTAWTVERAIREAVELAVVDLGKQIKAVIQVPLG